MASTSGLRPLTTTLSALRLTPTPRPFSTTTARPVKTIQIHKIPPPLAPAYPPGDRRLYKQSNRGLYGEARIVFADKVSGRNDTRTARTWKPNVHRKKLWSASLGAWVKTRLTTRVYRTIKKEGGLDEYLVAHGRRRTRELGPAGWRLRWLVMQTEAMQERFRKERERLGVKAAEAPEGDAQLRQDRIQIAMDYATPGGLSKSTREILARRGEMLEEEYGIGEGAENDDVEVKVVEVDESGEVVEGGDPFAEGKEAEPKKE